MNLYSSKQRWKIILVILAALIVGASLWYTGFVVDQIKADEKRKVEQWAEEVRQNIEQVNIQDSLYHQSTVAYELLTEWEKKEAQDLAAATQELGKEYNDYSFFISKIQSNDKIPIILMDPDGMPAEVRNLQFTKEDIKEIYNLEGPKLDSAYNDTLLKLTQAWSEENPPIEIEYIFNDKFKIYYRYSLEVDRLQSEILKLQKKSQSLLDDFNERLRKSIQTFSMVYVDAESGEVISSNLPEKILNNPTELKKRISEMHKEHEEIPVEIQGKVHGYIYYQNSDLVKQLSYFPYIQFGIIGLFLLVSYFLFSTFRKAEQNQVWVGMAKETAHQLGTPISSLMAWTEILKSQGIEDSMIDEINKDLHRLNTVTDRFSKIGSGGELSPTMVGPVVTSVMEYMGKRASSKVTINVEGDMNVEAQMNAPLFEWVIENLGKNAIDAMEGAGKIDVNISIDKEQVFIDISDTGKGIQSSQVKTVFEPGFTTKQRGWGLGLSLVKRIVEEYHKGKVFVLNSEVGKGTTFRVVLRKA